MAVLLEVPHLADLSNLDETLETIEAEIDYILGVLHYAQSQNETEIANRIGLLLEAIKPWLTILRAGAGFLAIHSTEENKGKTQ